MTPSTETSPTPVTTPSPPASPGTRPAVAFCWLPAELGVDQQGRRGLAGYLDVTIGAKLFDPAGNIIEIAGQWSLEAPPHLRGEPFISYSVVLRGWLPVRPQLVAPDGFHYAYWNPNGSANGPIYLVEATTQTYESVANPDGLQPIGYTKEGVWLAPGGRSGLWLLNPATKAIQQIEAAGLNHYWSLLEGGAIWGSNSPGLVGAPPPTTLLHFDLTAHVASTWYSLPGGTVTLLAVDASGAAAVTTARGSITSAGAVSAPGNFEPFAWGASNFVGARFETDTHGGWIISDSGVFLFDNSTGGMSRIGPQQTSDVVPAGECLQS